MNTFRIILALTVLIGLSVLNPGLHHAAEQLPSEYQVKSAFVYNFFTFVDWPSEVRKQADIVRLCVLGDVPAGQEFSDLNYSTVWDKTLLVSHIAPSDTFKKCQVIFISSSEERRLPRILDELKGSPILTIGDTPGFAQRGVMINFYLDNKKIRFEINAAAAGKAGLIISSKLLKLAGSVYGVPSGGE